MARKRGRRSKPFSFSMFPGDRQLIDELARERGWCPSRVVREAVRLYHRVWRDLLNTEEEP
jgi:hypothetical protein